MENERGEENTRTARIIDFHTHVLPSIDDGSRSLEMTTYMLEETRREGITKIVATPHFYPAWMEKESFLEKRKNAVLSLLASVYDKETMPLIYLGAEVAYYPALGESESIRDLSIVGTDTILVEMPFERWSSNDIEALIKAKNNLSLNIVIAHIERYAGYQKKETVPYLVENGIYIQSNAEYFNSYTTEREALKLLEKGMIHVLGSDMHNTSTRPQNLGKAKEKIKKHLGGEYLIALLENSRKLLHSAVAVDSLYREKWFEYS